jgi:Taurine catabolism dioxygenase TauD, TfdA family
VNTIEAIQVDLDDRGYFLDHGWTLDQLTLTMRNLGRIKQIDPICPQDDSSLFIRSKKPIPVHNEDPDVNWLAWYCEQAACDGGRTVLIDGDELGRVISQRTNVALRSVACSHRNPTLEPILSALGDWYLIPWNLPNALGREVLTALEELRAAISNLPNITCELKRGDILIVKNRRILHGREGFSDSSRKLIRITAMKR